MVWNVGVRRTCRHADKMHEQSCVNRKACGVYMWVMVICMTEGVRLIHQGRERKHAGAIELENHQKSAGDQWRVYHEVCCDGRVHDLQYRP